MQNINVSIIPEGVPQFIRYSQNDIGREFKINVVDFDIPSGATVECVATKPSGLGFTVSGTVTDNTVSFITTAIMTDERGKFPAELRISSGGEVLGTANFMFIGERNPHPEGTTDGQQGTIIPELTLLVNEIRESNARVAEMTASAHTSDVPTAEYDADTNNLEFGIPSISEEEFLKAFVTDSASGSIASFTDGGDDLPMKSLKVSIVPKQSGSGDPSPDNIRPISGWSGVNVTRAGKNLFNYEDSGISYIGMSQSNGVFTNRIADRREIFQPSIQWYNGSAYVGGTNLPSSAIGRQSVICNINSAITKIRIKHNGTMQDLGVDYPFTKTGTFTVSFTITGNAPNVVGGLSFKDVQIGLGSTATAYEPYQGESKYIPFKDENGDPVTVYGGEMEIVEGIGKSTMGMVDLGTLDWFYNATYNCFYSNTIGTSKKPLVGICSKYKYVGAYTNLTEKTFGYIFNDSVAVKDSGYNNDPTTFKTAMNGVQLCYELAEPIDLTTEPVEITTLLGNNNIYSSCGDVEVEYRADTKLYINKLLGNTRMLSMAMAPAPEETAEETTEEEPAEEEQR